MYTKGYKVYANRGTQRLTLVLQTGGGKMRLLEPRQTRFGCDTLYEFEQPTVRVEGSPRQFVKGAFNQIDTDWYVTISDPAAGVVPLLCSSKGAAFAIKRYAEKKMAKKKPDMNCAAGGGSQVSYKPIQAIRFDASSLEKDVAKTVRRMGYADVVAQSVGRAAKDSLLENLGAY